MVISVTFLVLSLVFILIVCAVFTNAVEWFGKKLNLSHGVTGSILAAVGTALPETIIPIIALVFSKGADAHEIGIGAIAGAPFMLATLGFFITGISVLVYSAAGKRSSRMTVDVKVFKRDITFFIIVYGIAILTTLIRDYILFKNAVAVLLILAYIYYIKLTFSGSSDHSEGEIDEFLLEKFFNIKPTMFWITAELALALIGIVVGAHLFVKYVGEVSGYIGISPLILSIIITPIATELPEKMNSIIWIGKKKDTLALGNITGAMVFQSCFPVAFGIILTPWHIEGITLVSASIALISAFINLIWVKINKNISPYILSMGLVLYMIFIIYVFIL